MILSKISNKCQKILFKKCVDWSKVEKNDYIDSMKQSPSDNAKVKKILKKALSDKINNREMFMKGTDYSYYYEED